MNECDFCNPCNDHNYLTLTGQTTSHCPFFSIYKPNLSCICVSTSLMFWCSLSIWRFINFKQFWRHMFTNVQICSTARLFWWTVHFTLQVLMTNDTYFRVQCIYLDLRGEILLERLLYLSLQNNWLADISLTSTELKWSTAFKRDISHHLYIKIKLERQNLNSKTENSFCKLQKWRKKNCLWNNPSIDHYLSRHLKPKK